MSLPTTPGSVHFFIASVALFVGTQVPFARMMQLSRWAITSWHTEGESYLEKDLPDSV